MVYDYVVVGSGFGGAVAAMRLAEKGYHVLVIEQGKRFADTDFPKTNWQIRKYLWVPAFGFYGIQKLTFFKHASVLTGVGVGGGSLVYANTLFYPPQTFFKHKNWNRFGDWESRLKPHYETAGFMMGRIRNPVLNPEDELLKKTAVSFGRQKSFEPVFVGVNFPENDEEHDPYFSGVGPPRKGCTQCAGCMLGCRENAKNTLEKNYLFFAEKFGAEIVAGYKATRIDYLNNEYEVTTVRSIGIRSGKKVFRAKNLVIAAGTLGTLKLLLEQKYRYKTLLKLSDRLGENLLTNSETLNAITIPGRKINNGVAISSGFHCDDETQIEIVKYPDHAGLMKVFFSFAVNGSSGPRQRVKNYLMAVIRHPLQFFRFLFRKSWASNTLILLVMQSAENSMKMKIQRGSFGSRMKIINNQKDKVPAYIPQGQKAMQKLAELSGGIPQNILLETLLNRPTTAHILGGCPMGETEHEGVVDPLFRVHGYPGMFITDGSVIQGNIGVNPSFTIMAQAEYCMSHITVKPGFSKPSLKSLINEKNHAN